MDIAGQNSASGASASPTAALGAATINGRAVSLPLDPDVMLVDVLRDTLALTGTKLVCGGGVCGACTVLLDGVPVVSCLLPARAVAGKSVTTIEGIGVETLHPVQKAFMALDALQCGFCTPGFIVEATAFHDGWRAAHGTATPSRDVIGAALAGHLCRCSAYDNILRAVAEACAGSYDGDAITSPRVEARAKVTGAAKYTVDISHDGQLEGLIVRSTRAHARIGALDPAPALQIPGVRAVIDLLAEDRVVRFVGQQIAAVAAVDRATARKARDALVVAYDALPAVIGVAMARQADAAEVFGRNTSAIGNASEGAVMPTRWSGNVRGPSSGFSLKGRDARAAIAAARAANNPLLVEATFRTSAQQHTSLEPHAAVARFDDGKLTVHASTQGVAHLRTLIAKHFKLNPSSVRVVAEHVGGGFGSKGALGQETIVSVRLAQAAKAPVRVVFDRHEELTVAGYRPGAEMQIAMLPGADGGLQAISLVATADTGTSINSTIAGLARLIYPAETKYLADFDVVSHLPPGAPFRGPGGPPMAFALEQAIDEAAVRMKLDPISLRKRWDPDPNRQRLYDWAAGLEVWRRAGESATRPAGAMPDGSPRYLRGVGMATGYWLYLWQPGSKVEVAIRGGRLVVSCAVQDIGTGTRSVLADLVAREFGFEPHEIEVRLGDSQWPEGPTSGGSRVTASVVPPTLLAIGKLKAALDAQRGARAKVGSNAPWRERIAASPDIAVTGTRPEDSKALAPGIRQPLKDAGIIGRLFGFLLRFRANLAVGAGVPSSVQVVEVEVDQLLGHTRVVSVHTGIAVGRLAAPVLAHGQATGSIIQGLGYALHEERTVDPRTGTILSATLDDYRMPGIADTPAMTVHFDEAGFEHVPGGSVGIGEVATVPTAAAIANAVRAATGVRPTEIPLRPDRMLALLKMRKPGFAA